MIYVAYVHAALCTVLFLLYFVRMRNLSFRVHELSFVAQNILSGIVCGYSAYITADTGTMHPLAVLAPLTAAMYLFRSRENYQVAKHTTISGHLDEPIHREFGV